MDDKSAMMWGTAVFRAGWHHDALQPRVIVRTKMLTLSAMIYHTARLGFEAQNAMAFRFLRLVTNPTKSANPHIVDTELADLPPAPARPPVAHTRRASVSKAAKKTTRDQKRSKRRRTTRR